MRLARLMALFAFVAAFAVWTTPIPATAQEESLSLDVPYVPTPQNVVDEMLKVANLKKGDVLYDLGCGDGRIVVTAAKRYGVRAVGVDLNPERIREANENAKREGVTDMVTFRLGNLFEADVRPATVVTLYLLPGVNLKLRPKLQSDLRSGSRIVSHSFDMGDWTPDKTVDIDGRKVYVWFVKGAGAKAAAKAAGAAHSH